MLRNRVGELETVESDLLRSEAQVKDLERKLRTFKHNGVNLDLCTLNCLE